MAIGRYYTMEFYNVEETFCKVLIGDNSIQITGTPEIIPMEPADSPLLLSTIDEGENKFTPIKGQQATISFLSDNAVSLQTFSDGPDDRFSVTVVYGTTIVFYGFLSLEDNTESFLPPRNVVTLTANDKLGALKEIPLTDDEGDNPQGKYTIGNLIAMCLKKTGLSLPLRVINNLKHGSGARTFQASFGDPNGFIALMSNADAGFFYVGQRVSISGTASNNIEFTVFSVSTGIVGAVSATEDVFTLEADANAMFVDVSSNHHFYRSIFLDAKTFETEIGESEDCRTVLEKILGYDCFLVQYKECWWICRVDEYDNNPFYVSRFDENGEYIDSYVEGALSKSIGFDEAETVNGDDVNVRYFSEEETKVLPTRPIGLAKLTYNFNYPAELICNQDFNRGTGDEPIDSEPNQTIDYEPECWTFYANHFDGSVWTDGTPQAGAVGKLVKRYEYGYDKDVYLYVEHEDVSGDDEVHYFKSQGVHLRASDKINLTVDFRLDADYGLTSLNPVQVTLVPYDGSAPWYWSINGSVNEWVQQATPTTNPFSVNWRWEGTRNDEWATIGGESKPLPAAGILYVHLASNFNIFAPFLFSNLQATYIPFINGSYRAYNGRYEKVTRTGTGYLSTVDDEVFISDADGKLFKGAMLFFDGTNYELTSRWYDASKFGLGNPTLDRIKPYGNLQAFAVWNQYRLANTVFQAKTQGFGADIPSLVHKFSISDASWASNDRYFLLLTKEADLKYCTMSAVLQECYRTTEGKSYDDPHEFKYIS